MEKLDAYVRRLRKIAPKYGLSPRTFFRDAKEIARREFGVDPNPVGAGNRKVGGPATHRPLDISCPVCPYEETCYAFFGFCRKHSKDSSGEVLPSIFAAAIAALYGERFNVPIRLHVTGGFAKDKKVDVEYVDALVRLGQQLRYQGPWAWSYTHFSEAAFEPYRLLLTAAGVEILYSDVPTAGGAVVWDFADIETLRKLFPLTTFAKCRYQLDKTPCVSCKLCENARKENLCIVFDPHGAKASLVRDISRTLLLGI